MGRPKKRRDLDEVSSEPFESTPEVPTHTMVNAADTAESGTKRRKRGVFVPLTADGKIDEARLRNKEGLNDVRAAIAAVPTGTESIAPTFAVTEEHINWFLDGYAQVCRVVIPKAIKQNSVALNKRDPRVPIIKIDPVLASSVYRFTPEQKAELAPHGAAFANEILPDWIKKWLFEIGPGAKFLGGLAMITWMQTQAVLELYKASHAEEFKAQPVNGHVKPQPENFQGE